MIYYYKDTNICDIDGEKWLPILSFPNYLVSNFGRIKSLPNRLHNGIIRKQFIDKNGYCVIGLQRLDKTFYNRVSRLVAYSFLGISDKPCVNHKNGIKSDNRVENLEWVTYSENTIHALRTKLLIIKKGADSPSCGNRSRAKMVLNLNTGIFYESARDAAKSAGIEQGYFRDMLAGRAKRKIPFMYV